MACAMAVISPIGVGDNNIYKNYSNYVWAGHMPYRDFVVEYPPGVLVPILLSQPVGFIMGGYTFGFLVLAGVVVSLIFWSWQKIRGYKWTLALAVLFLPILTFTYFQLDIFAAALLYASLIFLSKRRWEWSALLLALSTLIKAYPVVCLPAMYFTVPRKHRPRFLKVFGAVTVGGLLPFLIISPAGLVHSVLYHTNRPIEIGSGPAAVGFILHYFGLPIHAIYSHASQAVIFSGASLLGNISSVLLALSLVASIFLLSKKTVLKSPMIDCAVLLLIYIVFFKVGSQQFFIPTFLCAMLGMNELTKIDRPRLYARLLIINCALGSLLVVGHWDALYHGYKWYGGLMVVIKMSLITELLIWLIRRSDISPQKFKVRQLAGRDS